MVRMSHSAKNDSDQRTRRAARNEITPKSAITTAMPTLVRHSQLGARCRQYRSAAFAQVKAIRKNTAPMVS
jgi:hypothetical protein